MLNTGDGLSSPIKGIRRRGSQRAMRFPSGYVTRMTKKLRGSTAGQNQSPIGLCYQDCTDLEKEGGLLLKKKS